jgi:hypothetical protein
MHIYVMINIFLNKFYKQISWRHLIMVDRKLYKKCKCKEKKNTVKIWLKILDAGPILTLHTELSKSLSCLSDNRSGRCGQCVRPIKYLPDLHFFYNFNWITRILAKSIKWFVYSFKWYLGILKVSTTHFCVTCGNIHTIQ